MRIRRHRPVGCEILVVAALLLVLLCKFHAFDVAMLPRYRTTPSTLAGGLGVLLCLFAPLLLFPRRGRFSLMIAVDFVLSLLLFADLLHMRYYADLFALRNTIFAFQAGEVALSLGALAKLSDALYFADIPLFVFLALLLPRVGNAPFGCVVRRGGASSWRYRIWITLLLLVVGSFLAHNRLAAYESQVKGAMRAMWDRRAVATGIGSLLYHAADASNLLREAVGKQRYTAAETDALRDWLSNRSRVRAYSPSFGHALGKNLIVIQVESLQSFVLGFSVGGVEVTPHLNVLAAEGLFFPGTFVQTASGNSSDAELMANASLFPCADGVAFARFAGGRFETLASCLKERGYRAYAYHGDRPGFWNRDRMYPALGFDRYISRGDYVFSEAIGLGLSDAVFFEQTLGFLEALDGEETPFYAFLVTLSSHHPYGFPEISGQVTELPLGELEGTLLGDYLKAVRYADRQIGRFVAGLAEGDLLDESLLVVYGDHAAIQRGEAERLSALLKLDLSNEAAWRSINCVPLIVRLPHAAQRRVVREPAGQIDIAPTVASLMGFDLRTAMGRDLLAALDELSADEEAVLFRDGSFVSGGVYVLPGERRALDMTTGRSVPFTREREELANQVGLRLRRSDLILETSGWVQR